MQVMEGGDSRSKVTLTRDNVIIPPSTPVAYQLGDESLDAVCTSLDGPLCNADDKARVLAMERARAAGRTQPASTAASAGATQQQKQKQKQQSKVQTVKEFKFEKGQEVGSKVETSVKTGGAGGEEETTDVVIVKEVGEGEDINDVVSQVQSEIANALKLLEADGWKDEDSLNAADDDAGIPPSRQRRQQQPHPLDTANLLNDQDVRKCDVSGAGGGASSATAGRGTSGVCSHKGALYRCTKTEGNALAPGADPAAVPADKSKGSKWHPRRASV